LSLVEKDFSALLKTWEQAEKQPSTP
jgi:hypothetical protein